MSEGLHRTREVFRASTKYLKTNENTFNFLNYTKNQLSIHELALCVELINFFFMLSGMAAHYCGLLQTVP